MRKQDEPKHPKYQIGDDVFVLRDDKIAERTILGVITIFDRKLRLYSDRKQVPQFVEFRYYFGITDIVESYDWISESRVFASKEELLTSL